MDSDDEPVPKKSKRERKISVRGLRFQQQQQMAELKAVQQQRQQECARLKQLHRAAVKKREQVEQVIQQQQQQQHHQSTVTQEEGELPLLQSALNKQLDLEHQAKERLDQFRKESGLIEVAFLSSSSSSSTTTTTTTATTNATGATTTTSTSSVAEKEMVSTTSSAILSTETTTTTSSLEKMKTEQPQPQQQKQSLSSKQRKSHHGARSGGGGGGGGGHHQTVPITRVALSVVEKSAFFRSLSLASVACGDEPVNSRLMQLVHRFAATARCPVTVCVYKDVCTNLPRVSDGLAGGDYVTTGNWVAVRNRTPMAARHDHLMQDVLFGVVRGFFTLLLPEENTANNGERTDRGGGDDDDDAAAAAPAVPPSLVCVLTQVMPQFQPTQSKLNRQLPAHEFQVLGPLLVPADSLIAELVMRPLSNQLKMDKKSTGKSFLRASRQQ